MASEAQPLPGTGAPILKGPTLRRTWEAKTILERVFATVDHKHIGMRYLATSLFFLGVAGIGALVMRTQLAVPDNTLLSPRNYNELFTMHGTTMIFLVLTPMLFGGFGNYIVPMMLGTRDMAFPRLNAFSYWVYLLAAGFLYASFISGTPNTGWFAYVPLSEHPFSPGRGLDFWCLFMIFLSISTTAGAINFIATIFRLRAPGMTMARMPLFVWGILVTSFAVIFALPSLSLAAAFMLIDRQWGTHFYDPAFGGNPLLYQHLFWVFGHPEVYIMFLPAVGIVSTIVQMFSRTRVVGYLLLALATVSIGFISFGVWVHHMFATGLPLISLSFFSAASIFIVIPSGVQFFAWLATIWKGRVLWRVPFYFILGFLSIFLVGGFTGVMVAVTPFDWQVTDSYFIVAHFHYVLIGGVLFPAFAGFYYWLPKITGKMMNEWFGLLSFWLIFIGFNVAFFPMHLMGLYGMPRRVYTYQSGIGLDALNMTSTVGAYILAVGIFITGANLVWSLLTERKAGANPWNASTLEWATSSPPEAYNFRSIPVVASRDPLWDEDGGPNPTVWDSELAVAHGEQREIYSTSLMDAETDALLLMPEDSWYPLLLAGFIAMVMVGILLNMLTIIIIGAAIGTVIVTFWLWPVHTASEGAAEAAVESDYPTTMSGITAPATWGMWLVIMTESIFFALLFASYFYLRSSAGTWPLGVAEPHLLVPTIETGLLLLSLPTTLVAVWSIRRGGRVMMIAGLVLTMLLGIATLYLQIKGYTDLSFDANKNAYTSLFYVINIFHSVHLFVALMIVAFVLVQGMMKRFTPARLLAVDNAGWFWYFNVAAWLFVYLIVYLSPHMGSGG